MFSGTGNPGEEGKFPAGQRLYPFSFQLPPNLPSSYEGGIGFVRYLATCNVDVPWGFDIDTKRMFTVSSVFDLNTIPNILVAEAHNHIHLELLEVFMIFSLKEPGF